MLSPGHTARGTVTKVRLSLTPMIDVVFLLLIFFMVGMTFREQDRKLDTDLPRLGGPDRATSPIPELWIQIDDLTKGRGTPAPRVAIDGSVMRDWHQVYHRLHRLAQVPGNRRDRVVIDATGSARHGWVMRILDYLRQLDYANISFKQ